MSAFGRAYGDGDGPGFTARGDSRGRRWSTGVDPAVPPKRHSRQPQGQAQQMPRTSSHGSDDGGGFSTPGTPSLAVRLMQVAGEYELERKRQWQRAEARISELQEAKQSAERLAWSQGKQIEALNRQLTKTRERLEREISERGTAVHDSEASSALMLLGLRQELANKDILLARVRDSYKALGLAGVFDSIEAAVDLAVPDVASSASPALLGCDVSDKARLLDHVRSTSAGAAAEQLLQAAEAGDVDVISDILHPAYDASRQREWVQRARCTLGHALRQAAAGGHVGVVRTLLAAGAPWNVRSVSDGLAHTAVHVAASRGHEAVLRLLVSHANTSKAEGVPPVDVNDGDTTTATPLHLAAAHNRTSVVKYLLLNGADPNAKDKSELTALDTATAAGAQTCVRLLTDKNMLFWNSSVRANKQYNEKRYAAAIETYTVALNLAPDCSMSTSARDLATLHYNRARAAYRLGHHCKAVEDCTAALDKDESYRNALAQRAECYMSLFDFTRAVRDFQSLLDADPSDRQWARRLLDARSMRDMSHYQVLGLERDADQSSVKKAYRAHCLKWHPDKHHSSAEDQQRATTAFRRINEANEVLTDSYKRMMYDMEIRNAPVSGIQSDGFDRWYRKERDREAERAEESRRLLAAEEARKQLREKAKQEAAQLYQASKSAERTAHDLLHQATRRTRQRVRQEKQAETQARQESQARTRAAVTKAEDHVRSARALAEAHAAARHVAQRQVHEAKSDAAKAATSAAESITSSADAPQDVVASSGEAEAERSTMPETQEGASVRVSGAGTGYFSATSEASHADERLSEDARRDAVKRARELARRVQGEKLKELERRRMQQERSKQYSAAASRAAQAHAQREREIQAERQAMRLREEEFKRQVELELEMDDQGVLGGATHSSEGDDSPHNSGVLLSDSDPDTSFVSHGSGGLTMGPLTDDPVMVFDDEVTFDDASRLDDEDDSLDAAAMAAANARASPSPDGAGLGDGEQDQVMREVERLYRRERHRVAAEASLGSPRNDPASPRRGWDWSIPPEAHATADSPASSMPPSPD